MSPTVYNTPEHSTPEHSRQILCTVGNTYWKNDTNLNKSNSILLCCTELFYPAEESSALLELLVKDYEFCFTAELLQNTTKDLITMHNWKGFTR